MHVGQYRPAGFKVDLRGPVDFDVRVRGDQFAVRAVQHIHEAVFVGLDHHFARLSFDLHVRKHLLVGAVDVVYVIGCVLKITSNLTCFRPYRQHTGRVQAVHTFAWSGIVRFRIARTPIDEIELGIVRTRAPRRPSAVLPGVAVFGPCLRAGFAGRWDSVSAPQFLSRVRIPAVEETARGGFTTGHTGNQHAVGNDRSAGGVVALFKVGESLIPKFFAGLHVEREYMIIDGHAKELAVINRRRASIEGHMLDSWFNFHGRAPDLPAGFHINGKTPLAVDHVHHTVVNRRRRQLAQFIHGAYVPDGH